jgi:hypothetical protein
MTEQVGGVLCEPDAPTFTGRSVQLAGKSVAFAFVFSRTL